MAEVCQEALTVTYSHIFCHRELAYFFETEGDDNWMRSTVRKQKWLQRWLVFFMACAEMFGYNSGNEWFFGDYLHRKISCCLEQNLLQRG